ncbi:DUF5368 domain-containing protein [Pararhodospirillum photometricum]|uniref:Uncharacterized protein n=1 Tax=Pararhodospirillum photometricum DSM 122 TaxID=1150469 RepID=H6SNT5_PARPM|nr:DUF5368 domain-containing protein [Pararhodospirillum photometricum]CCG07007.1 Putative uncharacterized protein [Pararhodospirillum photometricum DSM 122]
MQNFNLFMLFVVLQEMMGPLLWILLLISLAGTGATAYVIWREGRVCSTRLLRCEAMGVVGGFAALALMAWVTHSGFTDAGGPVDWLLIGIIWGAGLVGTTILAYAGFGLRALLGRPDPAPRLIT